MVGIYKITSPTGKVYIGQSVNINKRVAAYRRGECYYQPKIYNSIRKHGWTNHKLEVILELKRAVGQNWLNYWECFFIDYYKSNNIDLLNVRGGGTFGKSAPESVARMKARKTGYYKGEQHPNAITVLQYTKTNEFIKEWQSITDAALNLNINRRSISYCCLGRYKTSGGYKWKHK